MAKSEKRKIGDIGEELTARFLEKKGYKIVERNYLKKWGEIDLVAQNKDGLHFIEVKSLTWRPGRQVGDQVAQEYMPEANIRLWKKQRMSRAIRTYLAERKIPDDTDFQIDIAAVYLDFVHKKARIRMLENVNL